ncbi:MAG: hypothetical protein HOH27_02110 [Acidimicrobiaceae bacterium]|jgi:hypothetical protein|nr:hypothetical protein [Acidimicrobiaceae bacterium]
MIIRVDAAGEIRVDEYDVFTDFHVEDSAGFSTADLAATMGGGTRADGEHLWIAETAVRHWLSGRIDETWDEGFSGMFDFARSKGWTNDAGTHLRAHVEYPDRFASDRLVPD